MKSQRGFTLAEMAIVVLLISIAMTMGLKTVTANLENAAYSETKSKQERIKIALIGFLRTNGRLPCPDTAATPTGIEPVAGCTTPVLGYGAVPWATLGLARETALDGWGNFFTYRVSDINPAPVAPAAPAVPRAKNVNQNWTLKTAAGFDIASLSSPSAGGNLSLQIDQRDSAGTLTTIAYNAVAVIYSHGKNGFGAKTVKGTTIAVPAAADEVINNTSGTTQFIIRSTTDSGTAIGGTYDDLVAYMTPQDLLQPMIDEKTLGGVCSFYCATPAAGCTTDTAKTIPIGNPGTTTAVTCP